MKIRIAIFEFLATPAYLWLHIAALLVGFRWVMVRENEDGDRQQ
jgi:hypothetical protein